MDFENTGVFDAQTDDFEQEPQNDAAFSLSGEPASSQVNNYSDNIDSSLARLSGDFATDDTYARAANIENGLTIDPKKYGKAKRIAERRGADVDLVFDNFEEFEARDKQLLLDDIVKKNPALKELATDSPEFMKLAANDCDKLQEISNNLTIYGTMDAPIKPIAAVKKAAYLYNENERRLDIFEEIGDLMTKEDAESQARLAVLVDEANKASLIDTSGLSDIGYNAVEQLPYMKRTMLPKVAATFTGAAVDAIVSAKVGAAGGAAAGSVVPGAGTAAGATIGTVGGAITGTIKGAVAGNAVGTAIAMKNTYDVETGSMYANLAVMKDENGQGFAKDDMITMSRAYGALSAAIELLPMETLARVIPGYNEAKKGMLKAGFKKAVQEALKNKTKTEAIRGILKNITFAAGAEGLEESAQELLQVIGERHLQDKYNDLPGYDFEKNAWGDDISRVAEAGYQGTKASLLFPMLGGAGRAYTETRAINEMRAIDSLQRGDEAKAELDNARMDNIQNTIQQLGELKENPEQVQAFLQRATRKSDIRDIYMSVEDAKLVLQSDAVKKNMDVMKKLGVLDSIERQIANQQEIGGAVKIAFADYGATVMSRQELYAAFKDIVKTYEDGLTMNELRQHQKTIESVVKEGQKLKEQNKADFDYIYERILENARVAGIPSEQARAAAEGNAYFYLGLARLHNLSAVQMFQQNELNFDYKIENSPARSAQLDKIIDVIRDEQIKGADQNLLRASRIVARKDINAIKKTLMSKIDNPNTADVKEYLRLLNAISDMKLNLEGMTNEDFAGQLQAYAAQSPVTVDIRRSDADRVRSGMFSASEKALADIQAQGTGGDYVFVGGGRIPVNYEVVELTDLITSHNIDGAVNEAYPQELQPRDRSRSASDAQIAEIVNNFAPERVAKAQTATEGAPIITKEGFVAVGNGRAMAISKVYENAEKAEQYRKYLAEQGYNVDNFAEPVLVRRLAMDLDSEQLQALVDDANTAGTMQYSDAEKAIAYSKKLKGEVIDLLDTDAELESAANRRFIREFFATVVPTAERNAFLDKDDKVTRKGIEMIENTLTAIIVPDARFLSVLVENPDNNIRKVTSGLAKSAPAIVAFENDIQSGLVDAKYSVAADIRQAVEVLKRAKDKGQDLDLYVKQLDLLEGHIPAEVLAVADLFDKSRSAVDFADKIKSYIRNASEQGDLTQANMFGIEPVSKIELLERMNAQRGLFQLPAGRKVYSVFDLKVGDHTAIGDVQEIDNENKTIKINDKLHSMILLDSQIQYKGLSVIDKHQNLDTFTQNNIDNTAENNIKKVSEYRSVIEYQKSCNAEYNKKAKDYFGITNNLDLGGYILTDGDILDLSGKKLGSDGRSRAIDHREISDAFDDNGVSMEDFINSGNIRYMPESYNLLMSDVPTTKQYKVIERIFERANGEIRIELMSDANNWGSDKDFSREYSAGTDFSTVKRDINAFYRGEGVREIMQYFQSAYAGSRIDYDKPSLEAIGSGEGAQVHGWGLYYALNKEVAEAYRKNFVTESDEYNYEYNMARLNKIEELGREKAIEHYTNKFNDAQKALDRFNSEHTKQEIMYDDDLLMEQSDLQAEVENAKYDLDYAKNYKSGQVHEVDIPENPYLLDEQKTFSEQSDFVKEKLKNLEEKIVEKYGFTAKFAAGSSLQKITGRDVYRKISNILGSDKASSQLLEKYGIKGITYNGQQDGRCFVIFNPADVKVIQKFYQQQEAEALGSFTPSTLTITLFKNANLSTIIHESGHFWREMIRKYAAMDGASEQLKNYSETLENWLDSEWSKHNEVVVQPDGSFTLFYNGEAIQTGFASREAAIEVAKHECFARAIETYFMTAEAPSYGLRKIFSTFKRWLLGVYKDAKELNVDITPEVKDVFDRLLASDGEIEQYVLEKRIRQMFDAPDKAKMSQKQFDRYKEYMDNMLTIAKDDYYKSLAAMAFKEKTAEFESKKADLRHDVLMQFSDTPENRFVIALVYGKIGDADIDIKANTAEIEATFNRVVPDGASRLPKRADGSTIFADDGMTFNELSEFFGLDTDVIKKTISQSPRLITAIEDTLRYQVHENLGSPVSYAEVEAQIVKSLHNDKYFDMLSLELSKLSPNPENQGAMEHALQARAEDIIGSLKITDIKPERYFNLSLKAGDNAIAALNRGNRNAAYTYKRQQLMNFFLYREAQKQLDFVDKAVRRLKQIGKKEVNPSVNQQHQDAARALLSRYSLANVLSQKQKERLGNLTRWIDEQRAAGYDIEVPTSILEAIDKKPYTDMSVNELAALNDVVKNIIHNGREIKTYELAGLQLEKEKLLEEMATQLKASYKPREKEKTGKQKKHIFRDFANTVDENLITLGGLCNRIDNGNANGVMHKAFLRPLTEAQNIENDLLRRFGDKMNELNNSLSEETKAALFENVPGTKEVLGADFTLGELISVGLNMGNYYNKQRMRSNFGDNRQFEQKLGWVARTLTQEHWDYIQGVWDLLDSMYPMLAEHQKKMSGLDMDQVLATPVITPYGTYRGGYYPIVYDKTASMEARDKNDAETALLESDYGRATTAKGYTKARLDRVNAPLKFGLATISQHIASVIHDVAYRQTIRQLWNLANSPSFMEMFDTYLESEYRDGLCQLLKSLANQPNRDARAVKKLDGYLRIIRNRTTTIGLAYRVTTAVAQTLGFFTSVAALNQRGRKNGGKRSGKYWLWRGIKAFAQSSENREWALANSGELRTRLNNNDVNIAEAMRGVAVEISRKQKIEAGFIRGGFWLIGKMDFMVAQSTWFAAYLQATQDFGYEHKDAVFYADRIMIDSQGTGNLKDTPLFQRSSELSRSLAMFYSPFAGLYQIWTQSAKDIKDKRQFAGAISDLFTALILPPLVEGILKGENPGADDDFAEWIKYFLLNPLFYWLSSIPIARDAASVMDFGRVPGSLYANAFNTVFQPIKKIYKMADGKDVKGNSFVKDLMNAAAMTTGIPIGGQIADWASWSTGIMTGEVKAESPADILYGIYRGKERK